MKTQTIRSLQDGRVLYQGAFSAFIPCLEAAVRDRADLQHADLRKKNLSNASLDDARLDGADLGGSNLSGANLSECSLRGARLAGASLYNTCLAFSDLEGCDFREACFGGTDIAGCSLTDCAFSSLSCFSLAFGHARTMRGSFFMTEGGTAAPMSRPPVVVFGIESVPIAFLDRDILVGYRVFTGDAAGLFGKIEIANPRLRRAFLRLQA